MNQAFAKKKAIILDGSHGLGRSIAEMLLTNGAGVIISGKEKALLEEAVKELSPFGPISGHVLDLSRDYDVELFIEELENHFSEKIDFLINATGFFNPKPFRETNINDYDALLDLNRGFFFLVKEIAKRMETTGSGAIVNISSFLPRHAAPAMATAGLEALTKQLSIELASAGIRVNAISSGTPDNLAAIVNVVEFLLSDKAANVSGAVWNIDRGSFTEYG